MSEQYYNIWKTISGRWTNADLLDHAQLSRHPLLLSEEVAIAWLSDFFDPDGFEVRAIPEYTVNECLSQRREDYDWLLSKEKELAAFVAKCNSKLDATRRKMHAMKWL